MAGLGFTSISYSGLYLASDSALFSAALSKASDAKSTSLGGDFVHENDWQRRAMEIQKHLPEIASDPSF